MSAVSVEITGGIDVGNGYVKGRLRCGADGATSIDIPSAVSVMPDVSALKPAAAEVPGIVNDIYNQMDMVVSGSPVPGVVETKHLFVGRRAVGSKITPRMFDIASARSKANDKLNVWLLLASVCGKALQNVYTPEAGFPREFIDVHAKIAVALPIREYKLQGKAFKEQMMSSVHTVQICNFDDPVVMQVTFDNIAVVPEGFAAQYAITQGGGVNLMAAMLQYGRSVMDTMPDDMKKGNLIYDVTPEMVLAARNTIGVDIGEGTVNFPVFRDGKPDTDIATNISMGYGQVLENAREELESLGHNFADRKALAEYLNHEPTPLNRRKYDVVQSYVKKHTDVLVSNILNAFTRALRSSGAQTEVVYVYGGGATPLREHLYKRMLDEMGENKQEDCLVLYMDSSWSRTLNREGLYIVASSL